MVDQPKIFIFQTGNGNFLKISVTYFQETYAYTLFRKICPQLHTMSLFMVTALQCLPIL